MKETFEQMAARRYPGKTKKAGPHGVLVAAKRAAYIEGLKDGPRELIELAEQVAAGQRGELKASFIFRVQTLARKALANYKNPPEQNQPGI